MVDKQNFPATKYPEKSHVCLGLGKASGFEFLKLRFVDEFRELTTRCFSGPAMGHQHLGRAAARSLPKGSYGLSVPGSVGGADGIWRWVYIV